MSVDDALAELQILANDHVEVQPLIDSLKNSKRGIVR
jgi:hypothetical protein